MPPAAPDFRRLFEGAPALYMVLAADPPRFTILAASDAYLRAVKKQRDASFIGRPVFEALPPGPEDTSSEPNSRASFQRAIDLRVPDTMAVQRHDIVRPAAEGGGYETRYWSPVNTPVLGEDGRVLYILHRVEDVTDFMLARQRGAEQEAVAESLRTRTGEMERELYERARELQAVNAQLREANGRLAEVDRDRTEFFSNVSHELRTPLTLILGALEEALPRAAPADREPLAVAQRSALRLLKLVDGLLRYARAEAGRAQPTFQPTDVGTLTAALAGSFASLADRGGVRLVLDCPPSPTPVHVDREAWERIVLNLVSNAFKFTPAGEIAVRVREAAGACELTVRDTGVGIPAEELPRVFERFHRAPARGRSAEGTGIGLSLVQQLVALHGGDVRAESAPGQGAAFVVTLPLGVAHLPPDRLAPAGTPSAESAAAALPFVEEARGWMEGGGAPVVAAPAPAARPDLERPLVLLADDSADMRSHIGRLLAPRYEVEAVADGEAALAAARRRRPDLVLTDVMMPRLDGFGLLRALRADPALRTVPVIVLSARAGQEAAGEGLEAGADDYLVKPFSAGELLARLGANLRLARMRTEAERAAARAEALADVDRRKNAFLATLSHELRNPLAPIRNSLFILARAAPGGAQARRAHETIDRQVAHLARLVEDLLDVSRIVQGRMQLQRERIDVAEVVRGAAEDARSTLERAGVALEVRVPDRRLAIDGDPTRLAQVVGNLLGNAAKFTPRGGHVAVDLRAEAGEAVLRVRDDGAGISPEVQAHLFQPFVQADDTLAHSSGGLGLGLAVVKGLVELHGGTVAAHSEGPGRGTEVIARLPLLAEERTARTAAAGAQAAGRPRRVLIIEDNPDAARTLQEALELVGHEVALAEAGAEGLQLARRLRPDAVVCDIGLPEMDGYAVARALRSEPALSGLCLVAVTGYAALDDRARSRAAGFDHHLPKPPDLEALARILGDCSPGAGPAPTGPSAG